MIRPLINFLRRCGVVLASARHRGVRYLDHTPVSAFNDVLLRVFPDLQGLRFIQVGANDGQRADPLQPFIDQYAWTGLMLEPLKGNFAALQRHRGANPRLRLRRAAVDVAAGRRLIYDLAPAATATLPDWARGLGSFSRARLEQVTRELGLPNTAIVAEEVETVAWDEVWREFGGKRCELLVLDTEGHDLTLLRSCGLAAHRPRLILFEHACNTLPERMEFYRELLELGYDLATCEGDTVASLPPDR
ncbi:MAG: FkbM family methyltransferase [Lacunisphaera sp.]|nr:FkbM family methyltransferase [Lacunisphaera sp.]